ncbi:MAG: GNAT family N-acetyltransferase [Chitinophagaceae bacterium]
MENQPSFIVRVATAEDKIYATQITSEMASSAQARGTGIAKRSPEYIQEKMEEGKAVIALTLSGTWVGFCYIEAWGHDEFVANSGLIVSPDFRGHGVATSIKRKIFDLSREKYPHAKIFGLTTGLAVMKINSELGYKPVTYSELTRDDEFWKGCKSCVNYETLISKERTNCFCTAMLYEPSQKVPEPELNTQENPEKLEAERNPVKKRQFAGNFRLFERWLRFKKHVLLKSAWKKEETDSSGAGNGGRKRFFLFNL